MEKRTSDEIREQSMARFFDLAGDKYNKGQEEHGGLLDETVTFEKIEEELIDGWFYVQSMKQRVKGNADHQSKALHERDRIMDGLQSRVFELKEELERVKVANDMYEKEFKEHQKYIIMNEKRAKKAEKELERWKEAAKR